MMVSLGVGRKNNAGESRKRERANT